MRKDGNLFVLFLLTLLSVVLLGSSVFVAVDKENVDKKINVELNDGENPVKLMDFVINPGEEVTYRVYIDADNQNQYKVSVWFEKVNPSLNNILYAYARYDTYKTHSKSVTMLDSNNKLMFNYTKTQQYHYFELVFYIPSEVGNEAQNLDFSFKTFINVEG